MFFWPLSKPTKSEQDRCCSIVKKVLFVALMVLVVGVFLRPQKSIDILGSSTVPDAQKPSGKFSESIRVAVASPAILGENTQAITEKITNAVSCDAPLRQWQETTTTAEVSRPYSELDGSVVKAEMRNLVGREFKRADWVDSGFGTVSSLIQTYYSAIACGNLERWMECMSPRELNAWQLFSNGQSETFKEELKGSIANVSLFRIESATRFGDREIIVVLRHVQIGKPDATERLAVLNTGTEWKIAGESGALRYRHHPADVSRYDNLSGEQ